MDGVECCACDAEDGVAWSAATRMYPQVIHGEIGEQPLEALAVVAQDVFMPLLTTPANQQGWPDVVAKEVTENLHKFVSNGGRWTWDSGMEAISGGGRAGRAGGTGQCRGVKTPTCPAAAPGAVLGEAAWWDEPACGGRLPVQLVGGQDGDCWVCASTRSTLPMLLTGAHLLMLCVLLCCSPSRRGGGHSPGAQCS